MRGNGKRNTHILSLDCLEWILYAITTTARIGVSAGHKRYILPHRDVSFLIVESQQCRR